MVEGIELKVAESLKTDVGRGIVRIDSKARDILDVTTGDVVEIKGKKTSVGIVWQAHPQDEGLNVIRMDGAIRQNTGVGLGDKVFIKKAEVKEARKVVFAPSQPLRFGPGFPELIKKRMEGRALVRGDMIFVSVFGTTTFPLTAAVVQPTGSVIITERTEVEIRREPMEVGRIPTVSYEDIGGLKEEIRKVREMIELPMRHPELFEKLGIEPPKGVLIHGPPGCGKTLLAKAVANESEANFKFIGGPELVSKFVGESEERLRQVFKEAAEHSPTIIFMDEIDAIAPKRSEATGEVERRMVSQLLSLLDGLQKRGEVIVIGATNRPNALDPALRRPGRFDREIEIGVPDRHARKEILQIHTRNMPLAKDIDIDRLADLTHGYSGADISLLAKEAAMKALRKIIPKIKLEEEIIPPEILEKLKVTNEDFMAAFREIQPSALREVFVEVPNVHWNEIGGLERIKGQLKEAVELPLKKPDIFKKMGIRTPKGILLYGPPGCGKTLLAKAVATESEANFISIKGPEIFCLAGEVPILTDHCGLRPIEEFYNNSLDNTILEHKDGNIEVRKPIKPIYSFGIDGEGNIKKTKIERIHKLFVPHTFELEFDDGIDITVSENQPFLSFKDSFVWKKAEEIEMGEVIAVPRALPSFDKNQLIQLPDYKHLRIVKENGKEYHAKIFSTKTITKLPKHLTKELSYFLGLFVAEGNITKEEISIACAIKNKKIRRKKVEKLFELFVPKSRIRFYKDRVSIYSTPLVYYLENVFGQNLRGKKSHSIKISPYIFKSTKENMAAFLKGAYDGDGYLSKVKVEYGTMSEKLAKGIVYLLTFLGIKSKLWKTAYGAYMVTISGKVEINKFLESVYGQRRGVMKKLYYNARYRMPDFSNLLRSLKKKLELHYERDIPEGLFEGVINKRVRCGLFRLRHMLKHLEKIKGIKNHEEYKILKSLAHGDLLWIKVKNKKKSSPRIMYDVETENSSFIGGELPLILHNSKWVGESEKAVRELFRKARMSAPCIIFIDEIDALASARGLETGPRVGERVLNTLLLELSGIEELKHIIVIAATNRPDILDPALLRPGRFDSLLEVPFPDKKTRLEILKVHTKKMPLAKEVSLETINEKLEGYSGADIEGVCREAGMNAIRAERSKVQTGDFEKALEAIRATVKKEHMERIKKFEESVGGMYR